MSPAAAGAAAVAGLLALSLAGAIWRVRPSRRRESTRDRFIREACQSPRLRPAPVHDVGPDVLLLLEDLDVHFDRHVLQHPDVADGFARLDRALREEPQGES